MKDERRCQRCLIKEDVQSNIVLDENGICNLCRQNLSESRMDWESLEEIFLSKIEKNRGKGQYDGVVMMSGGKDSAYLALTLKKKYHLNIVGLINDIHYEYQETFVNAKHICDELEIPLVYNELSKNKMKHFFRFLFLSKDIRDRGCGQICNYCGRLMIRTAADYAKSHNIPMLFSGHNPEQIAGMGQSYEIDRRRILRQKILNQILSDNIKKVRELLIKENMETLLPYFPMELFPKGVEGLFMYQHFPYEPLMMMEVIQKELKWKPIKKMSDTYIASGCRLAHLWIKIASLNNTPNYVDLELSSQVRNGVLSREIVKQFYNEAYDATEEIDKLLEELSIDSINELL